MFYFVFKFSQKYNLQNSFIQYIKFKKKGAFC